MNICCILGFFTCSRVNCRGAKCIRAEVSFFCLLLFSLAFFWMEFSLFLRVFIIEVLCYQCNTFTCGGFLLLFAPFFFGNLFFWCCLFFLMLSSFFNAFFLRVYIIEVPPYRCKTCTCVVFILFVFLMFSFSSRSYHRGATLPMQDVYVRRVSLGLSLRGLR